MVLCCGESYACKQKTDEILTNYILGPIKLLSLFWVRFFLTTVYKY